jgi:hypothetical protein
VNVFVGKTRSGDIRRALLSFDILEHIPVGSTIHSVSLTLHVSKTSSGPQSVSLHRVLADWGEGISVAGRGGGSGGPSAEGDATWLHRSYKAELWDTPGGDFSAQASADTLVNNTGFYTFGSTPEMVSDVNGWLDNPAGNFGWILIGDEGPTTPTSKRFDSRDNPTVAFRPLLTINFTPDRQCTAPVKSDLNDDCIVDFKDFAIFASQWLEDNRPLQNEGMVRIEGVGDFYFNPTDVDTTRPDIFREGYFSLFDILVHLNDSGSISMKYHYDENMNTHIIDSINDTTNWWYYAYYDGGWPERNAFRMDHYPYKDAMTFRVRQEDPDIVENIYASFTDEIARKVQNGGRVVIPEVTIEDCNQNTMIFHDVVVEPHDLRTDAFQEGTITAIDVILSLADQGELTYGLNWYDSVGTAEVARSFWLEKIDDCQASGMCGFVYEEGSERLRVFNHIHIPSDFRVINSPEYEKWFWIQLGPCN